MKQTAPLPRVTAAINIASLVSQEGMDKPTTQTTSTHVGPLENPLPQLSSIEQARLKTTCRRALRCCKAAALEL